MFVLEGYFDESGDLEYDSGIFCVAGYFITADAAKLMDEEWGAVLHAHQIPYFHMVDCAHGNKVFKDIPVEERIEILKKLIALIKKYTAEGFAFVAKADSYDPPLKDAPDPYSYCAAVCVDALQMFLKMNRIEANVAYFFEEGHKNKNSAYNHVAKKIKRETDSLTFAAKKNVQLLQAADLLAWQCAKYAKDYAFLRFIGEKPTRLPRKDFLSLMEHDHSFIYMGPEKSMAIELWPLSKRSQTTVPITPVEHDGPITYWREGGDDTPIIPVEKSFGWRMGGAKFAYLGFHGFKDKKFALAFNEPRLFEALGMFLQATGLFEKSEILPLISAENVTINEVDGEKILRIKILGGASIGLVLSQEVLDRLKEIIRDK